MDIGEILRTELEKEGTPSLNDFASMLGISYRTIFHVFSGKSKLTFDQVVRASEILKFDLISRYLEVNNKTKSWAEPDEQFQRQRKTISINLTVVGDLNSFTMDFAGFLTACNSEAAKHGFTLK